MKPLKQLPLRLLRPYVKRKARTPCSLHTRNRLEWMMMPSSTCATGPTLTWMSQVVIWGLCCLIERIQHHPTWEELSWFTFWITDELTGGPWVGRLENCLSGMVVISTGAPQGTVLGSLLSPQKDWWYDSCGTGTWLKLLVTGVMRTASYCTPPRLRRR